MLAIPTACPHCGKTPANLERHLRDTGGVRTAEGCPVLLAKREGHPCLS